MTTRKLALLRLVMVFIILPGCVAAVGAIFEHIMYGSCSQNYHVRFMVYASYIAAPFMLLRWFWSWPQHTAKLAFSIYIIQTSAFIFALSNSTIAGLDTHYTVAHIHTIFQNDQYKQIVDKEDVYAWLRASLKNVYGTTADNASETSRLLPGRLALYGALRLKQSRSMSTDCSSTLDLSGLTIKTCYENYSPENADKSTYSDLNFTYVNPSYLNYAGRRIYASDVDRTGDLNTYPMSGHWVLWRYDLQWNDVLGMVNAMEKHGWINDHTREISFDFNVVTLDVSSPIVCIVMFTIERSSSGRFSPAPAVISPNFLDSVDISFNENSTGILDGKCGDNVDLQKAYVVPTYLGMLPIVFYMVFVHVLRLRKDWRLYARSTFTYTELAWVTAISVSVVLRWVSIYFGHCDVYQYEQTMWPSQEAYTVQHFEFLQIGKFWYLS